MPIRKVTIPVAAGRNLAVLVEAAVRNFVLQPARHRQHEGIHRAAAEADGRRRLTPCADDGARMDLVLIGGVSGSGKSVALAALEDSGYYASTTCRCRCSPRRVAYLARARQDARRGRARRQDRARPAEPRRARSTRCAPPGWTVRFLYLDAKTDTLVKRFSETRRRHPFSSDDAHADRGDRVRARAARRRARGSASTFDTSDLPAAALRALDQGFRQRRSRRGSRCCSSRSASSTACRSTPTSCSTCAACPIRTTSRALQPLTGRDAAGGRVPRARSPKSSACTRDIYHFVASWLPDYARDNRNYLTVAIGCTGGRHRSVYLAERLARAFSPRYQVLHAPSRARHERGADRDAR